MVLELVLGSGHHVCTSGSRGPGRPKDHFRRRKLAGEVETRAKLSHRFDPWGKVSTAPSISSTSSCAYFLHSHIFSSAHILSCISAHPRISLPPQHLYLSRTCLLVFICKYAFGLWTCMRCIIVWAFSGEFFESLSATSTPTVSLR